MSNNIKSLLMVGVGGQGIVLASNVLCSAALYARVDVKKSEIHGMAQRGGSVVSHVRYGEKVYSPVIPQGGADFVVSFERMEYLRYMNFIKTGSVLILNARRILPPGVAMGQEVYPDDLIEDEKSCFAETCEFDADGLAREAGNAKAAGMVMLGRLSTFLDIHNSAWEKAIRENIKPGILDVNLEAFKIGARNHS